MIWKSSSYKWNLMRKESHTFWSASTLAACIQGYKFLGTTNAAFKSCPKTFIRQRRSSGVFEHITNPRLPISTKNQSYAFSVRLCCSDGLYQQVAKILRNIQSRTGLCRKADHYDRRDNERHYQQAAAGFKTAG